MMEERLILLKKMLLESDYLVILKGIGVSMECGCTSYRRSKYAYEIEEKYGRSPEEIFSAGFYNTRVREFFEFYKNDLISSLGEINDGLKEAGRYGSIENDNHPGHFFSGSQSRL